MYLWLHIQTFLMLWCAGLVCTRQNSTFVKYRNPSGFLGQLAIGNEIISDNIYVSIGILETYVRIAEKYSKLFLVWIGPVPIVVLLTPEYVQVGC
jgi:hypothetical protein